MNRRRWLAVVLTLQVLGLLGWAGYHEWSRATARTILLETAPVDPRDLLRGDYMVLNYKISSVPLPEGAGADRSAEAGQAIWVQLRPAGRFHEIVATSWSPIEGTGTDVVVRGKLGYSNRRWDRTVNYGIEKFFVPEGLGTPTFKEMVVEATVTQDGRLGIKRLLLDGKSYP